MRSTLVWIATLIAVVVGSYVGAIFGARMAGAQEAPPNTECATLAYVVGELEKAHEKYAILDTRSLIGVTGDNLGKILVTTMGGVLVLGFEMDGCMKGPVTVTRISTEA